jgi:thioesterase domain-containing protein
VVVRALGYAPHVANVALRPGRDAEVAVALTRVVRLARVTARGRRSAATTRLLDDVARRGRIAIASVIDSTNIQRWTQLRTAFQQVPFVTVRSLGAGAWGLVAPNTGCVMPVAVDHRLTEWEEVTDLPPDYVLAIEVYRRPRQVPAELQWLVTQAAASGRPACGLALVWTRSAR